MMEQQGDTIKRNSDRVAPKKKKATIWEVTDKGEKCTSKKKPQASTREEERMEKSTSEKKKRRKNRGKGDNIFEIFFSSSSPTQYPLEVDNTATGEEASYFPMKEKRKTYGTWERKDDERG